MFPGFGLKMYLPEWSTQPCACEKPQSRNDGIAARVYREYAIRFGHTSVPCEPVQPVGGTRTYEERIRSVAPIDCRLQG